nr:hypothetical protein [Bacteroidota bacterium]
YVIPMALEKTNDISFMILVGVGGENGIRQTAFLIQEQLKCDGISEKDAIPVIEKTSIPTLVFFGELDKNVDPVQGMKAYRRALHKAGNTNYKIVLIEGTDHNIIISETGCMSERRARSGKGWSNYDMGYLTMMEDWLKQLNSTPMK